MTSLRCNAEILQGTWNSQISILVETNGVSYQNCAGNTERLFEISQIEAVMPDNSRVTIAFRDCDLTMQLNFDSRQAQESFVGILDALRRATH